MTNRPSQITYTPDPTWVDQWPEGKHPPMRPETINDTPEEAAAREETRAASARLWADPEFRTFIEAAIERFNLRHPTQPLHFRPNPTPPTPV